MNQKKDIVVTDYISSAQVDFEAIADKEMNWLKEYNYAVQAMKKNDYMVTCARANPDSLKYAMINVAGVGLTLNPAQRLAYLVPRDNMICLDISYIGLLKLAVLDGGVLWGQAKAVRKNDLFQLRGFDKEPVHEYSPFDTIEKRGDIIGYYCVIKTSDGSYLTNTMTHDECMKIRDRTQIWQKSKSGPWKTDEEQMCLKTVIKRGSKLWPKGATHRLEKAIHVLNEHEGIDFEEEVKEKKKLKVVSEESNLLNNVLGKKELAPPKPTDPEIIDSIAASIELCKKLCQNFTHEQKVEFMEKEMGIKNFNEIYVMDKDMVFDLENHLMVLANEKWEKENPDPDKLTVNDVPWDDDGKV